MMGSELMRPSLVNGKWQMIRLLDHFGCGVFYNLIDLMILIISDD